MSMNRHALPMLPSIDVPGAKEQMPPNKVSSLGPWRVLEPIERPAAER